MAAPERIVDHYRLSKEQLDLIQQFEADFNAVEHSSGQALGSEKHVAFTHLVRNYAKEHAGWGDAELLRRIAKIRNLIVHEKTEPFRYVVVPTPAIS